MVEWFYVEGVLADRARDLEKRLTETAPLRALETPWGRPVLSSGLEGWSWRRAAELATLVGLALLATVALPAGIMGAAWAMGMLAGLFAG